MNSNQVPCADEFDYERSGLSIQQAMLTAAKSPDRKAGPVAIRWGKRRVQTSDCISVPFKGKVRLEFLSGSPMRQGFDAKVNGKILLADGRGVSTLRTWKDAELEDTVEYEFTSEDGKMWVWNVYEVSFPSGEVRAAKWSDNAGLWVEREEPGNYVYHCSAGTCSPADFSSLVVRLSITS